MQKNTQFHHFGLRLLPLSLSYNEASAATGMALALAWRLHLLVGML